MIGISGPSCSGKTLLAHRLAEVLPASTVAIVALDSYYRDLSSLEWPARAGYNFDAPESMDWPLATRDLQTLVRGKEVDTPVYDFTTHTRAPQTQRVRPGEFIIVEGLFALYKAAIRELYRTSVFVAADDQTCLSRRKTRDTRDRGRTAESVLTQYNETVRPMAERYALPTRKFADIVVSGEGSVEQSVAAVLAHIAASRA